MKFSELAYLKEDICRVVTFSLGAHAYRKRASVRQSNALGSQGNESKGWPLNLAVWVSLFISVVVAINPVISSMDRFFTVVYYQVLPKRVACLGWEVVEPN
ncbi:MAG: hypothetical protein D6808_08215 [Candidatus Dadabacteria bacterium]|nr:MAG: hypothetical protein D6808_08215 [Candidatus Dadabacteria bacterium]